MRRITTASRRIARADADRPVVSVTEVEMPEVDDDWYTPKILHLRPLVVTATGGKKGSGRIRCEIEQAEWEQEVLSLRLLFEKGRVPGRHYHCCDAHSEVANDFGHGPSCTFTVADIDRLIAVLVAAREKAESCGLFKVRSTPTSLDEVVAARREELLAAAQ